MLEKLKSPRGRARGSGCATEKDEKKLIENVYLATLSRLPRPEEVAIVGRHIASLEGDTAKAMQDLQFALMNSSEFLLRH